MFSFYQEQICLLTVSFGQSWSCFPLSVWAFKGLSLEGTLPQPNLSGQYFDCCFNPSPGSWFRARASSGCAGVCPYYNLAVLLFATHICDCTSNQHPGQCCRYLLCFFSHVWCSPNPGVRFWQLVSLQASSSPILSSLPLLYYLSRSSFLLKIYLFTWKIEPCEDWGKREREERSSLPKWPQSPCGWQGPHTWPSSPAYHTHQWRAGSGAE